MAFARQETIVHGDQSDDLIEALVASSAACSC
jgi:hypothetical protein